MRAVSMVMLAAAASMGASFLVVHLAGMREMTAILSGTVPATEGEILLGLAYVLCWFAFVLLAPILALAGAMGLVVNGVLRRRPGRRPGLST